MRLEWLRESLWHFESSERARHDAIARCEAHARRYTDFFIYSPFASYLVLARRARLALTIGVGAAPILMVFPLGRIASDGRKLATVNPCLTILARLIIPCIIGH